jgi:hypothetical protein
MKFSRDSLPNRTGPFTTAPGDRGGRTLRDRSLFNRLYPRDHSHPAARPRLGETAAVIVEVPIILAASWPVCRWCVDWLNVRRTVPVRSLMGLVAFLVLMSVEVGMGAMFGRSLVDQLDSCRYSAGAIGLAAQVIFAIFPALQVWRRFGKPLDRQNTATL